MDTLTEKHFKQPIIESPSAVVKFVNFSDEDFTHTWNNIPYTFKAGGVKFMEQGLAKHFAKHLINRELLKRGRDNDTSPKKPEENPFYMELYNKCVTPVATNGETDQTKIEQEAIDRDMKAKLGMDEPSDEDEKTEAPVAPAKKGKKPLKAKKEAEFEEITPPDADLEE